MRDERSLPKRQEDEILRKLGAFAGQIRASELYRRVNWGYLPPDTGNRVLHALTCMPAVRIQLTDDVPNRAAFIALRSEFREKWGIFATFESVRLAWDLRGEPTAPNDVRVTVVMPSAPNLQNLRGLVTTCSVGKYSLHIVERYDDVPQVIAQIKGVIRSWFTSRYV